MSTVKMPKSGTKDPYAQLVRIQFRIFELATTTEVGPRQLIPLVKIWLQVELFKRHLRPNIYASRKRVHEGPQAVIASAVELDCAT